MRKYELIIDINELPYIQLHLFFFNMKSFLFDREIGVIAFILFFSSFAYTHSLSFSLALLFSYQ